MVTTQDLKEYVGGSTVDEPFIEDCLIQAQELVDAYVATTDVPESILDNAYLQTGSELFHRRSAPSGIAQFATFDGAPVRVSLDPMKSVYSLLQRWVVSGV
jgi:hypothetical protein